MKAKLHNPTAKSYKLQLLTGRECQITILLLIWQIENRAATRLTDLPSGSFYHTKAKGNAY